MHYYLSSILNESGVENIAGNKINSYVDDSIVTRKAEILVIRKRFERNGRKKPVFKNWTFMQSVLRISLNSLWLKLKKHG